MIDNNISMQEVDEVEYQPVKTDEQTNLKNIFGDNWYKLHPEKILGEPYEASGKFGTITKYRGDISVISRIEVDDDFIGNAKILNDPLASVSNDINISAELQNPEVNKFVNEVIAKSFEELKTKKKLSEKKEDKNAEVKPIGELNSFQQTFKNLNPEISIEEIEVFTWYKSFIGKPLSKNFVKLFREDMFNGETAEQLRETYNYSVENYKINDWVAQGLLCYYKGELLPRFEYQSGNMYDKKIKLESEKDEIVSKYGEQVYENQQIALKEAFDVIYKKRLLIGGENSLVVLANSKLAKQFMIKRIDDIPEEKKFKIMKVTARSDKDYGKPDFLKDIKVYGDWKKEEFDELSLTDAFSWWILNKKPQLKEPISHLDIYKYYVESTPIKIAYDKNDEAEKKKAQAQKEKLKSSTQREGERLFSEFLQTQLLPSDKLRLETQWNIDFNNYLPVNLDKVPVAFTMAKYIFGEEEKVKAEKRDAVAFTLNNGTGILAYDVGVGKTPSAIFTMSAFMDAGYCKKPLLVVPNQVYRQFISEIKMFCPHIPINEGYNLGKEYIENLTNPDGNISVPDGSITVMTYEGFENIGFSDTTSEILTDKLYDILNQGNEDESAKKIASFRERIETIVGKGLKGGMYNIEDFGFDFMCYDEAHKMKKVFTNVKGEVEEDERGKTSRGKNPYAISSGSPSSIGLKGFMINYYILQKNDYKNILMLTATPFTNSPLEIFSMLSMVAYETLRDSSLDNLKSFFDNYVKTSTELVINTKLKPQFKQVILGFNNLISLQSLIRRFILYKTGDEVGVKRPKKFVLPYLKEIENGLIVDVPEERRVETYIPMTPSQKGMMNEIIAYVEGNGSLGSSIDLGEDEQSKDDDESADITGGGVDIDEDSLNENEKRGVRTIKGLAFSRNLALSPYLYDFSGLGKPKTYKDYVENSPKILYVMKCVKSVRDYCISNGQQIAGQVIYMDRGIEYFGMLKEYLVNELGYNENEIGIIKSGLPKTGTRSKEYVKNLFNGEIYNEKTKEFEKVDDAKRIKVVIGSSTIKEGMNLQKYGAVLYNCFIDWNPTDIQQLEGRIYRQKNTYDAVRIVNPLVVDSADIFLFQKLQEKTARLNSIWSTDGKTNALNTNEFNPEELKYALIKDPNVIAELRIIEEEARIDSDILGLQRQLEIGQRLKEASYNVKYNYPKLLELYRKYRDFDETGNMVADAMKLMQSVNDLEKKQTDRFGKKIYDSWDKRYLKPEELAEASDIDGEFYKPYYFTDYAVNTRDLNRYVNDFVKQYNIPFSVENPDASIKSFEDDVKNNIKSLEEAKNNLKSEENIQRLVEEAIEEKEKQKINYKSVPQLITDFSKLNYLLDKKKVIIPKVVEKYTTCPPMEADGKTRAIDEEALTKLAECIKKEPQTKSLNFDEKTGYTLERKKLHNKIINDLFSKVKCVKSGEQPIAIFTGGSPASGKSYFITKNAKYLLNDFIFKLDADEIREKLPEYKGWNANSTQQETTDIVNELLDRLGSERCRYDFVYDGTMNKSKRYFPLIKKVKELGYKVYIIFMEVPYAVAKERVIERYQRKGRYVPVEVIDDFFTLQGNKTKGQVTLDELKPYVDGYIVADGITGDVIDEGGEGLPDVRSKRIYTTPVLDETKVEEVVETPQKATEEEIMIKIDALQILADMGDKDAEDKIEILKLLI